MIFPDNYKFVGIKDREERGSKIYFSTQYLISRDGPSLYYVKSNGSGFMREVEELELIASGQQIAFYPQRVDTRNRTLLVDLAYEITREERANTVVFQGQDEHITFVKDPDPGQILTIEVMDVSPPNPPWLIHALRGLEECGVLGDQMVRFVPRILNLEKFYCPSVYYPCRAGGLGRSLDSDPVTHDRPRIVGREVSREIFRLTIRAKSSSSSMSVPCTARKQNCSPKAPSSPDAADRKGEGRLKSAASQGWLSTGETGPGR